jgi:hypothetical protein
MHRKSGEARKHVLFGPYHPSNIAKRRRAKYEARGNRRPKSRLGYYKRRPQIKYPPPDDEARKYRIKLNPTRVPSVARVSGGHEGGINVLNAILKRFTRKRAKFIGEKKIAKSKQSIENGVRNELRNCLSYRNARETRPVSSTEANIFRHS